MADEQQPFMTRRGFFQRLFGGEDRVEASFFGLQIVFDAAGQEELRERIQAHLDDAQVESVDDKRRFYKILTSLLREAEPYYDYAFFDLVMGARDAEESFSEWVHDIEAGIATEEEETSDDIDGYHRMDNSQRYIVVSILLHFEGKHPLYGKHEASLDQIYTRAGIGALVESVNRVNFEHLLGDAAFLVPGSPEDGFSSLDFADDGWAHLRPMSF